MTKMFRQRGGSGSAWISLQGPDFSGMGNLQGLAPRTGGHSRHKGMYKAVLGIRIQIHRIRMFLGLPDPDPLVRGADPAPDPSLFS
jgi:hypothetical protein